MQRLKCRETMVSGKKFFSSVRPYVCILRVKFNAPRQRKFRATDTCFMFEVGERTANTTPCPARITSSQTFGKTSFPVVGCSGKCSTSWSERQTSGEVARQVAEPDTLLATILREIGKVSACYRVSILCIIWPNCFACVVGALCSMQCCFSSRP